MKVLTAVAGLAVSTSAMAQTWDEASNGGGDAGDLPTTAQMCVGAGTLSTITGDNGVDDVDMFGFEVTSYASFGATTVGGAGFDTQLWLFDALGRGITFNDDSAAGTQSTLTAQFLTSNGQYFIAITRYNIDAQNAANALIWANTPWGVERAPDGPGAGDPVVRSWTGTTPAGGAYSIALTGAEFISSGPSGACCRTDGSCVVTSAASCASQNGIYRGDNSPCATANCPQPPTGACCFATGCEVRTQAQCAAQGGAYQGNNTSCGTTNCPVVVYVESGDAGDLPQTAAVVSGSGSLQQIRGECTAGDVDMFQINICTPGSFGATTVGGATWDTQLWLFNGDGLGITCNDDAGGGLQSILTSQFVSSLPTGNYYLAITGFNNDAWDASNALIWSTNTPESQPNGPGAANPIRAWSGGGAAGTYTIALQGSCFVGGTTGCYANCDGSTTAPILNVNDFICFQGLYAAGDSRANCDGSTTQPVLNVNDFICFQGRYAAGCP